MIQKRAFFFRGLLFTAVAIGALGAIGVRETRSMGQQTGRSITTGADHPNFSGTWRLNVAQSEITSSEGLAGLGAAAPENLHITQALNGALILSSRINGAQPRNYIIGGENSLPAPGGEDARMVVSSRWDGNNLVNEGSGEVEGKLVVVREMFSLSADGQLLQLEVTTTIVGTKVTNIIIYNKAGN
jgi:hypothetical protein